ncbi:MAG TPA: class I lanthipeptide [Thermoanaerobaculia bacterium]|nr:class I lanthipeptide [Thermoanaerobaculia bacterium]
MKKKEMIKKLALSRETLVHLTSPEMKHALGGAWSDGSVCPSATTTKGEPWTQETC